MKYLRQVRPVRAREELLESDLARTTASRVALKWRFGHSGRFAAEYE